MRAFAPYLAAPLALTLVAAAVPADAQIPAPVEIHACYVPLTGTVYRIGEPGLRPTCASPAHVEFSWVDRVGKGTIHTGHLANGAVTTDKLADGAVTLPKLGFDPATQEEFDVLGTMNRTRTVNAPDNPVHWTRLKGVPAGFADGVDDGGGVGSDLDCVGCVESEEIADGTVGGEDLGSQVVRGGLAGHIAHETISGVNIARGGVEFHNIANGAVRGQHLFPGAVATDHLATGAVTGQKLATGAVRGVHVGDGSITGDDIQNGSLTAADIGVSYGTQMVDFPFFDPFRCWTKSVKPTGLDANDVVIVNRGSELPSSLATVDIQRDGPDSFEIRMCTSGATFDPGPVSFHYIVFEVPGS